MAEFAPVEQALNSVRKTVDAVKNAESMTLDLAKQYLAFCSELSEAKEKAYKHVLLDFISMEQEVNQYIDAVRETMVQLQGSDADNFAAIIEAKVAEKRSRNSAGDLEQHPLFEEMAEEMAAKRVVAAGQEQCIVDEDLQMTVDAVQTKCPYTGMEMVNPVKNKHCGHTYDRDGILDYVRQKARRAKCPVGGCPNPHPLAPEDLVENKEVRRYIERMKKSTQQGS